MILILIFKTFHIWMVMFQNALLMGFTSLNLLDLQELALEYRTLIPEIYFLLLSCLNKDTDTINFATHFRKFTEGTKT